MAGEIRFLTDEDLRGPIIEGVKRRLPHLDIVRVQDVGLRTSDDRDVLEFAATDNRILLSQDVTTLMNFVLERLTTGKSMPGVFLIPDTIPIGLAVESIVILAECSTQDEWSNRVQYLPL